MIRFTIRLAGINIRIHAKYAVNQKRMKDYLTEEEPAFTIEATTEDLKETDRRMKICNGDDFVCSGSYLEFAAIHSLISDALLDYDVLMMHGSALSLDGAGYIFTAKSGTGKSTHSALWREVYGSRVRMVNDDKPMLLCKEDEIIACGSPWNGKEGLGENTSVKLKAIAYLERGVENRIHHVRPEDVFHLLYIQTYHSENPQRAIKAMELLSRITKNVKMYRLQVNMHQEAATVAYEGMQ